MAAVVIMMSYKTGRYDGKQKKFVKYDNYKNYRFSGPDWYFFEHDASKPYPYGYSVKSLTQKKQEFAEWLKKYEEKAYWLSLFLDFFSLSFFCILDM